MKDFECYPLWHLFTKALASSKVCHKGYRIIVDSEPAQSGMLHKHTNEWIGLREEKSRLRFRQLDFSGNNGSWEKEVRGCQFDAV